MTLTFGEELDRMTLTFGEELVLMTLMEGDVRARVLYRMTWDFEGESRLWRRSLLNAAAEDTGTQRMRMRLDLVWSCFYKKREKIMYFSYVSQHQSS